MKRMNFPERRKQRRLDAKKRQAAHETDKKLLREALELTSLSKRSNKQ